MVLGVLFGMRCIAEGGVDIINLSPLFCLSH